MINNGYLELANGVQSSVECRSLEEFVSSCWEKGLHHLGEFDSTPIEIFLIEISLESCDVSLDFCLMREEAVIGGAVDLHLALRLPALEPVCDDSVIRSDSTDTCAAFKECVELGQVTHKLLDCGKDLLVVLSDEVRVNIADVGFELWSVLETFLHVCLVVVSSESEHES